MRTVLIAGGTGLIGKSLTDEFSEQGYKVIILTRNPSAHAHEEADYIKYASWNIDEQTIDTSAIQEADTIIHLAGEGVADKRWSAKRKKEILESRTKSSALLIKAIRETPNKIKTVVCASAIGWYGEDPRIPNAKPFVETDQSSYDFLGETCRQWEESIQPVALFGKRLVKLRTGIVLSNKGGALPSFKKPIRFGAAGILGSGKQVVSWIHIDDLCRMYLMAVEDPNLFGVYNAVAPRPVTNKELTVKLAKCIKGNFYVPVHIPAFALKAALGEMSIEVLKSTTVSCDKIRKAGFNFIFPSIDSALNELIIK
jgi:uncharacterized protein (TIGR01777 family)